MNFNQAVLFFSTVIYCNGIQALITVPTNTPSTITSMTKTHSTLVPVVDQRKMWWSTSSPTRSCPPLCGEERQPFHGNNPNLVDTKEVGFDDYVYDPHEPELKWTKKLEGNFGKLSGPGVRQGNGVVVSPNDEEIWVTDDEGGVHIIDYHSQKEITYHPSPLSPSHWIESRSSISIYDNATNFLAVYAITDIGPSSEIEIKRYLNNNATSSTISIKSRVIALDRRGKNLWQTIISGQAKGTPKISSNGRYVFVGHNEDEVKGSVTVLDTWQNGETIKSYSQSGPGSLYTQAPYGPLTIQGKHGYDEVYWVESWAEGHGEKSWLHKAIVTPDSVSFKSVKKVFSSVTAPTVSEDLTQMFLGGRKGDVAGWRSGDEFDRSPSWKVRLETSFRNITQPMMSQSTMSLDGDYLLVPTATNSFFCLDTYSGYARWKDSSSESVYISSPRISEDGKFVYTIQSRDGTVTSHRISSGKRQWQFNCGSITKRSDCQDSVEADFAVSMHGDLIYYADIFGHVNALQVSHPRPTFSPTMSLSPSSSEKPSLNPSRHPSRDPTGVPSTSPSTTMTPSSKLSMMPSHGPSALPTSSPSLFSSNAPSDGPSVPPSHTPSHSPLPTSHPSISSSKPSFRPSSEPTESPSSFLTLIEVEIRNKTFYSNTIDVIPEKIATGSSSSARSINAGLLCSWVRRSIVGMALIWLS